MNNESELLERMNRIDKENLYEMANIRPNRTGLSMVIWVFPKTGKEKHFARIKVAVKYGDKITDNFFTVKISNTPEVIGDTGEIKPKDVEKVVEFVKLNQKVLLNVWNDILSPDEAIPLFIKV